MLRSLLFGLFVASLLHVAPPIRPGPQGPPIQTGRWVQRELADWLPGTFTNTYVEGSGLRLQPSQTQGQFESTPFQAPFGFNAGVVDTVFQATAGQTLTVELRSSRDGVDWTAWQPADPVTSIDDRTLSQLFVFQPFTSWLQYRVLWNTIADSPSLDEVVITFISSTAGPALVDLVGRVPLAGPPTQTPAPLAVARADWSGIPTGPVIERQRPQRVALTQVRAPVDDPNSAATLRALRWVTTQRYGLPDLPFHYLVDGTGTVFEVQAGATVRLPAIEAGVVRIGLLADAQSEGLSEATQAALTGLLAWLGEAYRLDPAAIDAGSDAPVRLRELLDELRTNTDRAIVRWRRFFPEGSLANGVGRLVLVNDRADEVYTTLIGYTNRGEERRSLVVPPNRRVDVTLNTAFPDAEALGLQVLANHPLQAERTHIVGREIMISGGAADPARTWYFAAGDTTEGSQAYLLLINPQAVPTDALLFVYPQGAQPMTHTITLQPRIRNTVLLNDLVPDQRFALKLVAAQPVVAERSIFRSSGAAGVAPGGSQLSRRWLFAEGTTTGEYATTLHLFNPWPQQLSVTVQVLSEDGTTVNRRYAASPLGALAISLNEVAPNLPFAWEVQAERPVYAERELSYAGGQAVTFGAGAPRPATRWSFAEGSTAPPSEQFLLIGNPNPAPVAVDIVYTLADGSTQRLIRSLPPTSRLSVAVNADVPGQPVLRMVVTADRPVVAERSIYVRGADGVGNETNLGVPGR